MQSAGECNTVKCCGILKCNILRSFKVTFYHNSQKCNPIFGQFDNRILHHLFLFDLPMGTKHWKVYGLFLKYWNFWESFHSFLPCYNLFKKLKLHACSGKPWDNTNLLILGTRIHTTQGYQDQSLLISSQLQFVFVS